MRSIPLATRATWRLFAIYLAVTAVPVVALGLLLASGFRSEAQDRGVREGGRRPPCSPRRRSCPISGAAP